MARLSASVRPSHAAWKTGSFGSGSTLPKPCMPPMSWMPSITRPPSDFSASPVPIMLSRVTSAASFSSLQPSVPAGRIGSTMKRVSAVESQTRISVSCRQRDAEIGQHAARIVDRARAIGRRFVPDRRQPEHFPRIAGAQRADDHVVQLRRVLDRDQVIADAVEQTERGDRLAGVLEQRLLERRIAPGLGDDAGAVMRADLGLIGLDDGVERRRIDIALLGQHGFERAHAQLHFRQLGAVVVVMVVVVSSSWAMAASGFPVLAQLRFAAADAIIVRRGTAMRNDGRAAHRRDRASIAHRGHRPRGGVVLPLRRARRIRRGGDALCARHRARSGCRNPCSTPMPRCSCWLPPGRCKSTAMCGSIFSMRRQRRGRRR